MSALAAGHGSAARRGYSNAAVAYFVALAFGLPALVEQRRAQSENLSQLVYEYSLPNLNRGQDTRVYSHHRYVDFSDDHVHFLCANLAISQNLAGACDSQHLPVWPSGRPCLGPYAYQYMYM